MDGWVVRNRGLVEEQVLTGESRPVLKEPGDRILGGTLNLDGDLTSEVAAVGEDGTLAQVVEWCSGRASRKAGTSGWPTGPRAGSFRPFRPLHSGLQCPLGVRLVGARPLDGPGRHPDRLPLCAWPRRSLAVWSALGNAASQRVLFRSGEALERLADITAVRFDKTGTLTTGSAAVAECVVEDPGDLATAISLAAKLASSSSHAMSRGIVEFAKTRSDAAELRRLGYEGSSRPGCGGEAADVAFADRTGEPAAHARARVSDGPGSVVSGWRRGIARAGREPGRLEHPDAWIVRLR